MGMYAENTKVPVSRSRAEIKAILDRYGCTKTAFVDDEDESKAEVAFFAHGRFVRVALPLPEPLPKGSTAAGEARRQQVIRQRWRSLALFVKSKLDAVQSGITSFEKEWLAHTMIPTRHGMRPVSDVALPQITAAYERKDADDPPILQLTFRP